MQDSVEKKAEKANLREKELYLSVICIEMAMKTRIFDIIE